MADKTDGSVVLAQPQAAFLWECVITRDLVHSPKLGGKNSKKSPLIVLKKINRKVQGVPQSQTAANPRH